MHGSIHSLTISAGYNVCPAIQLLPVNKQHRHDHIRGERLFLNFVEFYRRRSKHATIFSSDWISKHFCTVGFGTCIAGRFGCGVALTGAD